MSPQDVITVLGSAGLGAGFYALWTGNKYIKNRTYDPRYEPVYLVRWFLGLIAGTILGLAVGPHIDELQEYGPSILALIGGWSSDAVAQILNRLAETLVAAVRGTGGEQVKAELARMQAEADTAQGKQRLAVLQALQKIRDEAASSDVLSQIEDSLDAAMRQIEG